MLDAHFLTWTYLSTLVDNTVTAPSNDFTFKVFIRAYNFPGKEVRRLSEGHFSNKTKFNIDVISWLIAIYYVYSK